jgi:hypothetical protein
MLDCMVRIWLFVIGCAILRSKTGSLAGNTSLASLDVFLCSKLTTSAISSYFFPDRGSVWYCSGYQKNPLQQKYARNVKCFFKYTMFGIAAASKSGYLFLMLLVSFIEEHLFNICYNRNHIRNDS